MVLCSVRVPIPVAGRPMANACSQSLAGIAGSNAAGGMVVCGVCCTVQDKRQSQDNRNKDVQIKHR